MDRSLPLGALGHPSASPYREGMAALASSLLDRPALPPHVLHLGLSLAFAQVGCERDSVVHGTLAVSAGLTYQQAVEALTAAFLSRGLGLVTRTQWILDHCDPGGGQASAEPPVTGGARAEDVLAYFETTFHTIPNWLRALADGAPGTLEAYFRLRELTFADRALLRRHKELLLVMVNATERYREGLRVHLDGAVQGGASPDELLCAVRASILTGGMVAWLEAAELLAPLLEVGEQPPNDGGNG